MSDGGERRAFVRAETIDMRAARMLDRTDPTAILNYAAHLKGMTFREVLALGIHPEGAIATYDDVQFKGGMGNLIEERFFGYRANSDELPDFPEAGVELKTTCFDVCNDGEPSAGERLVISMIPYDRPVGRELEDSHVWEKLARILLVFYERNRSIDKLDQRIRYVALYTPCGKDLEVIRQDYRRIAELVRQGRADELSEASTNYLAACTKGASEKTMWTPQYYAPDRSAKRRAFCLKRSYVNYILHKDVLGEADAAVPIVKDLASLGSKSLERYVEETVARYVGMTDKGLCRLFGLPYTGGKAQWCTLVYRMLGVRGERAEEFDKANVSLRVIRAEADGVRVRENLSLAPFEFAGLVAERTWEDSELFEYLSTTRFFFVVFQKAHAANDPSVLLGSSFWSMSMTDINGDARRCWETTRRVVSEGVRLEAVERVPGQCRVKNNLPSLKDNAVIHVRPHASRAYYRGMNLPSIGDNPADGSALPDGRIMTKQSFWIGHPLLEQVVAGIVDKNSM